MKDDVKMNPADDRATEKYFIWVRANAVLKNLYELQREEENENK